MTVRPGFSKCGILFLGKKLIGTGTKISTSQSFLEVRKPYLGILGTKEILCLLFLVFD